MTTDLPPDAIALLFEADPLPLSDADLMTLATELRRRRSIFASEEAVKALKPKKERVERLPTTASSAAEADKPVSEVSLEDLD